MILRINNLYLFICIVILLLSGTIFYTKQWGAFQPFMLAIPVIAIYILAFLKNITLNLNLGVTVNFTIFTILCIISSLLNSDVVLLARSGILFLTYFGCVIILPNLLLKYYTYDFLNKFVVDAFLFSHLPLIFIPIFIDGITLNWYNAYQGIFYNPNALGLVLVSVISVLISEILNMLETKIFNYEKINKFTFLIRVLLFFSLSILVVISRCRTAAVTVVLLSIISLSLLVKKLIRRAKINIRALKKLVLILSVLFVLIVVGILFTPFGDMIDTFIMSKFILRKDDLTDGRKDVWIHTIEESKMFGYGRGFFENTISAHNTFISILAQYGWFPTLIFIIILLQIFNKVYIYAMSMSDDKYKFFPLLIFLTFFFTSLTEGMLYKVSMFLLFISYGISVIGLKYKK